MTDVWKFETMRGEDRPDHPTLKPIEMIERIIKTSGTKDTPILAPFMGSAPEMVASQNNGYRCFGVEKAPEFCAVTLERMSQAFPGIEIVKL